MIIRNENTLAVSAPKTYLASGIAIGATTSPVKNTAGLTTSWAVQIGQTGEETSEVLIGTNASGTSITHPATSFEHPADTPVYFIKYDQVVFERSTAGTAGTATPMTNGTITYQPDFWDPKTQKSFTIFDDTTGSVSYAYRTYFRNSTLAVNTTESDWIVITPSFYSLAVMRDRVKEKLWDSTYLKDSQVDNWINEWLFEMRNSAIAVNEDYALGTVDVGFDGTDGFGTVTTADFKQLRRVDVTYNGQDYFLATKMNINDFLPNEEFSSVHPYITWRGDNIFRIRPDESGGTARITFYRIGTTMVNDTDELELPMRGYTKSFVDYGLSQAYLKDGKQSEAQGKLIEAAAAKQQFTDQLTPRIKTGPTSVDVVEPVSSWDGWP